MSTEIEILQKQIDEITTQLVWMYEEMRELEDERLELEDYKSTLVNPKIEKIPPLLALHIDDPCPECGTQLKDQRSGGVCCPSCGYWFCF